MKVLVLNLLLLSFARADNVVMVERTGSMPGFPCMKCHQHTDPQSEGNLPHHRTEIHHMETGGDCYLCHDKADRNQLRLLSGTTISFDASHEMCLQCHGDKKREWLDGTHGKQIGSWNGQRYRLQCVECHNPHSPAFKKMKPDPSPKRPKFSIPKGTH
ncbi:MAG: cytochrome c3 family protein [Bdellovibrionales bacterium]|nr:cytochrome c3 family protein [Bdellovibrionales bacterium]